MMKTLPNAPRLPVVLFVCCLLAACAPAPAPAAVPSAAAALPSSTTRPRPTATHTSPPRPTATRVPSPTPRPTRTPRFVPSPTPIEIKPTSIPVRYSGSGYGVVVLENPPVPALLHIVGGGCQEVFFVRGRDSNGNVNLLIQSESAYDGVRLVNTPDQPVKVIDITTSCDWALEVQPVEDAETIVSPGQVAHTGDYVFRVAGPVRTIRNERTPDKAFFAFGYAAGDWSRSTSIFAAHDVAPLPPGITLVEVNADTTCTWTIQLEE